MDIRQETKEFDHMMVMAQVTPELGFGHGSINTESISDNEAQERAYELKQYIEDADPKAGCGCIDGRCVVHTMAGGEAKLGPKLAGGNSITMLFSVELNDYYQDDRSAFKHYSRVVEILESEYKPVRMHTDTETFGVIQSKLDELQEDIQILDMPDFIAKLADMDIPGGTACGMNDKTPEAFYNMSRLPKMLQQEDGTKRSETEEEMSQRLEFLRAITEALDPESFVDAVFEQHIDHATELHQAGFFDSWQSVKAALVLAKVLHDRGSEESVLDRIDVLEANDEGVHGHIEWAVAAHNIRGKVLNNSRYAKETGKQVFAIDLWAAEDNAVALATGPNAKEQQQPLYQGQLTTQVAGYISLGNGSQRVIAFSA